MGKGRLTQRQPGKVRIIGGKWRGRRLPVPDCAGLRPTPDRVRETLFNWLQPLVNGAVCLDLYAGTGILGLEAISRGAAAAVLVEADPLLAGHIRRSIALLGAGREVHVEELEARAWLRRSRAQFDLVFLDPPFGQGLVERSLGLLRAQHALRPGARIYVEAEPGLQAPEDFRVVRHGRAGKVQFLLGELL